MRKAALGAIRTSPGAPLPFGARPSGTGTQFSAFSRNATAVSLLLFDSPQSSVPVREIELDPRLNRTGDVWHVRVEGVGPGAFYLYRVDGPWQPEAGHRFDAGKLLLDPYVKAVTGNFEWKPRSGDAGSLPKGIVLGDDFDWRGDRPLARPLRFTTIYETHVRSLTLSPTSGAAHPGTFRGVTEKIPYFVDLGITAVELLPVQEFDELDNPRVNPRTGERLQNYWGYNTITFFAPKGRYSSAGALGEQVSEFKEMVRALHSAGIEVILDIVFNHTAEGDETGPTLCFRGWDNSIYYMLDPDDPSRYRNYTACGNTLNCNHPIVRGLIVDCLRYWVVEMHVDGFRFDLGSVLGRDRDGRLMANPPILERIAEDPVLRQTKIIAEAWDAAGAYQVGSFPGGRWAEWNDKFRSDARRFWRGDEGMVPHLATRLSGSSDLYLRDGRKPFHSVNFVTSHDGLTLNDLVSYSRKHNEENGEANADGLTPEESSNHGVEGPTHDRAIEAVRNRQVKNLLATLLLSLGTPMILGGDEIRRTQRGNSNAWCQNNEISWYDWRGLEKHADVHRFCRELLAFRRRHPAFLRPEFYSGKAQRHDLIPDIAWLTEDALPADWNRQRRTLAMVIRGTTSEHEADRDTDDVLLMLNAEDHPVSFLLPAAPRGPWRRAIDTALPSPSDILAAGQEEPAAEAARLLEARSLVVMLSR